MPEQPRDATEPYALESICGRCWEYGTGVVAVGSSSRSRIVDITRSGNFCQCFPQITQPSPIFVYLPAIFKGCRRHPGVPVPSLYGGKVNEAQCEVPRFGMCEAARLVVGSLHAGCQRAGRVLEVVGAGGYPFPEKGAAGKIFGVAPSRPPMWWNGLVF